MPQLIGMKRGSVSSNRFATYLSPATFSSPGTPIFHDNNLGFQKGWCSERVPLPVNRSRRHISSAALMPFNSGRTFLPSKWEDAERWITSPVSGYGGINKDSLYQTQRRPRSKSGPLGPSGIGYYSNYPASMHVAEGGSVRNFMGPGSPFSAGVMVTDGLSLHYGGQSFPVHNEHAVARSASLPECSDLISESSTPSSQDEKLDGTNDSETMVSRAASRRDMATQMSPDGSTNSSPKGLSLPSPLPPSLLPIVEPHSDHSAILEVRDVQVDKWATVLRWSKRYGTRTSKKNSLDVEESYKSSVEPRNSSWDIEDAAKKLQREEAKIIAWENLQKAKAEAALRKVEMKLERKRSSSMDKILNKLKMSQMKAQEMRSSMSERLAQTPTTRHKFNVQMGSLSCCFTCHAS